ncbi:colicin-like pore-forming protein [Morganella morganii]|uniref:Colicin-like pore-forming protein n=1 Tax=Morganella morganii TaxID=582 RepID=A0AAE4FCC9_MORMO|nr:colicin-like pore-forming protein [Morganella morganii]MCT1587183.1 colicin-like pore-forming protein [Morganella morganii]MDS0898623.1 colicin-like pore-forming protein [Morganella morganii]MDS0906487.1 colicin-like pore-forming protein [Morganella morganii]CDK68026.1 Colicin protein [Morganella morganii IS15]
MTNRYEDTTPFERDVMTSMGYHWKGEGWQKASDNGETMVVTGWTGDIPADSSRITHIWDQNIADMNTSPNPVWDDADDGWMHPVDEEIRKERREESARKLKYLTALEEDINKDISEIIKNIAEVNEKIKNASDVLESATLNVIVKKLQLQKEKVINLLNEARKRKSDAERKRLSDESWFYNSELNRRMQDKTDDEIKKEWKKGKSITQEIVLQDERIEIAENDVIKEEDEFSQVKTAVKFTADFYKEVFSVYGDKAEQLAGALAEQAKGKKIRDIDDALKAYEKYRNNFNKKMNSEDRKAIVAALESIKSAEIAKNFTKFSKGMGVLSHAINAFDWVGELIKSVKTDNWRPFFVKTEVIAAGNAATVVVAFIFSVLLGNPVGLIGYGLIMAGTGVLIDDELAEKANLFWGI